MQTATTINPNDNESSLKEENMKNKFADAAAASSAFRRSSSLEVFSQLTPNVSSLEEQKVVLQVEHHPKSLTTSIHEGEAFNVELTTSERDIHNLDKDELSPGLKAAANNSSGRAQNTSDSMDLKIRVGVCCMQKKLASRPMREILKFLDNNQEIEICRFNDAMLLEAPIEEWLRCDVLIGFYSTGFPLQKAIAYVQKYKPVQINALEVQHELWDRVKVLDKLRKIDVPVAKRLVVYREAPHEFTQEEIEAQALGTKDKGEYYINFNKQGKVVDNTAADGTNSSDRRKDSEPPNNASNLINTMSSLEELSASTTVANLTKSTSLEEKK